MNKKTFEKAMKEIGLTKDFTKDGAVDYHRIATMVCIYFYQQANECRENGRPFSADSYRERAELVDSYLN